MADIIFIKTRWTAEAEAVMRAASGLSDAYTVEDLRSEVQADRSALLQVIERRGAERFLLGWLAMWIEPQGNGSEMVIHAGAALADEASTFAKVSPHIDRLAQQHGCASVRAHVNGGRRLKLLTRHGYERAEIVLRKWV